MDEFAQSREDDDLFADEFEPVAEQAAVVVQDTPELPPTAKETAAATIQQQPQQRNGRRDPAEPRERRGRGGRGGGRVTHNGLTSSRYANAPVEPGPAPAQAAETAPLPTSQPSTNTSSDPEIPLPTSQNATPTLPAVEQRIPAVRGDRSATGGPAHKKLTEEELTAKLEKMAILNAQKAERHRLSEADQAAFQHREKELAKERKEKAVAEKRNERVMEMERAKNRERKMKAQGGREWDSEKVEADIVDGRNKGRRSEFVRGGFGGVINANSRATGGGLAGSRYAEEGGEEPDTAFMRGKGGFEIRGRGGRGRGGQGRGGKVAAANTVPSTEDFPSLPPAKTEPSTVSAKAAESSIETAGPEVSATKESFPTIDTPTQATEQVTSPGEKPAGDWAEEMATPVEEKKMAI